MKVMMSSCLIGKDVMYWGGNILAQDILNYINTFEGVEIVNFCPEHIMLGTPRKNMLIHNGDGDDLWNGEAQLFDTDGLELTDVMKEGAFKMLAFAKSENPDLIILTEGSDSCGVNLILDSEIMEKEGISKLRPGMGVAAALLKKHGFKLFSHKEIDKIKYFLTN